MSGCRKDGGGGFDLRWATLPCVVYQTGRNSEEFDGEEDTSTSTSEAKELSTHFDFDALREKVLIPDLISDCSLRGEASHAHRDLDPCLEQLDVHVEVVERFKVVGYIGHL